MVLLLSSGQAEDLVSCLPVACEICGTRYSVSSWNQFLPSLLGALKTERKHMGLSPTGELAIREKTFGERLDNETSKTLLDQSKRYVRHYGFSPQDVKIYYRRQAPRQAPPASCDAELSSFTLDCIPEDLSDKLISHYRYGDGKILAIGTWPGFAVKLIEQALSCIALTRYHLPKTLQDCGLGIGVVPAHDTQRCSLSIGQYWLKTDRSPLELVRTAAKVTQLCGLIPRNYTVFYRQSAAAAPHTTAEAKTSVLQPADKTPAQPVVKDKNLAWRDHGLSCFTLDQFPQNFSGYSLRHFRYRGQLHEAQDWQKLAVKIAEIICALLPTGHLPRLSTLILGEGRISNHDPFRLPLLNGKFWLWQGDLKDHELLRTLNEVIPDCGLNRSDFEIFYTHTTSIKSPLASSPGKPPVVIKQDEPVPSATVTASQQAPAVPKTNLTPQPQRTENRKHPLPELSHCKPTKLHMGQASLSVNSWSHMLINFFEHLYEAKPEALLALRDKACFFGHSILISAVSKDFYRPKNIAPSLWVETIFSANSTLRFMLEATEKTNYPLEDFCIEYCTKNGKLHMWPPQQTKQSPAQPPNSSTSAPQATATLPATPREITPSTPASLPKPATLPAQPASPPAPVVTASSAMHQFNLAAYPEDLRHTKVHAYSYKGQRKSVASWRDLVFTIAEFACSQLKDGRLPWELSKAYDMGEGSVRANDPYRTNLLQGKFWIYLNKNAQKLIMHLEQIVRYCGLEPRDFVIFYAGEKAQDTPQPSVTPAETLPPPAFDREKQELLTYHIGQKYPEGFVMSPANVELFQGQLPPALRQFELSVCLRACMFQREDNVCLLPTMVATNEQLKNIKTGISELLGDHELGLAAASVLMSRWPLAKLSKPRDYVGFIRRFVLPEASAWNCGGDSCLLSLPPERQREQILSRAAEALRERLAGSERTSNDLLSDFETLDESSLTWLLEQSLGKDIVPLPPEDGTPRWKLLEDFYLPEDFDQQLQNIVANLEEDDGKATLEQILARLSTRNDSDNFAEDYALENDDVAKAVILKSWTGEPHVWKRQTFEATGRASRGKRQGSVIENFFQLHAGPFHFNDFRDTATSELGLKNMRDELIVVQVLLPKAVRLNENKWISPQDFRRLADWDEAKMAGVEEALLQLLGDGGRFLSMQSLHRSAFYNLPEVVIDSQSYPWNPHLLASLLRFFARRVTYFDTGKSTSQVQGVVLPGQKDLDEFELLDYVLQDYLRRPCLHSVDGAFDYLKDLGLKQQKSPKLTAYLERIIGN